MKDNNKVRAALFTLDVTEYQCDVVSKVISNTYLDDGIAWIALNDDLGADDPLNEKEIAGYISTCLLADLMGTTTKQIAKRVVQYRKEHFNKKAKRET